MKILIVAVLIALALYLAWVFNRFIALKVRARNAWSDIDVQLKRRRDLVPALVETVKGYAAHERTTLEQTIAARGRAGEAGSPRDVAETESTLGRHVHRLIALAEAYPDLKADEMFRSLHDQLVEVENHLQSARRYYNAVVRDFNTALQVFPQSLVARVLGFRERAFFELDEAAEAAAPAVEWEEKPS